MRAALVSGRDRRAEIGEPSCKRASTTPAATSPAPPVIFPAAAKDLSPNGFKAVVDIDLLGTFHVMRAAYPHMRRAGGSIIDISAPQATIPMAMQIHVCAAKAGLDMVTRCLAIEWGPEGLRVNGVVPGPIDAPTCPPRPHRGDARRDHRLGADAALRQPAGRGRRLPLARLPPPPT